MTQHTMARIMALNNALPYRQSIRMPGFDYRQAGAYFITICTHGREPLFGRIVEGVMHLNAAGQMVRSVWDDIPMFYPGIEIDEFIVMPDHVHGIIHLVGAAPCGRPGYENHGRRFDDAMHGKNGRPQGAAPTTLSLSDVVHRFKSISTNRYGNGVASQGWHPFIGRLWHRNYWERIIRDDRECAAVRAYIRNNPSRPA